MTEERIEWEAQTDEAGERVDSLIARRAGISRAAAQRLISDGCVLVNGEKPAKSRVLAAGCRVCVSIPPPREACARPEAIPLDIVHEDEHLLVVDKPKGMVVHPAPGSPAGTLVNALMHHCAASLSGIGGQLRPGIVHRIDKDTSGLLVVAKDDETHLALSAQFARHSINRVYQAIVYGHFGAAQGEIDAPIGRSRIDRKKMSVTEKNAKSAVTRFAVLREYPGFSHIELRLLTGRTHQIRVHMAAQGHPVAGDTVYGPRRAIKRLHGQCLHAGVLGFVHPATRRYAEFSSPLPPYFREFAALLAAGAAAAGAELYLEDSAHG